ncbi:MAG: hypothetical protein VYD87_14350 [Pseudomonadota bacterium]|nr:hypothetical protein [Pseudomonadota bacterium]
MWFIAAACLDPRLWRFGRQVRTDDSGGHLVTWWCAGPIAFAAEREG